jgi:hypothetical protein
MGVQLMLKAGKDREPFLHFDFRQGGMEREQEGLGR